METSERRAAVKSILLGAPTLMDRRAASRLVRSVMVDKYNFTYPNHTMIQRDLEWYDKLATEPIDRKLLARKLRNKVFELIDKAAAQDRYADAMRAIEWLAKLYDLTVDDLHDGGNEDRLEMFANKLMEKIDERASS